MDAKKIKHLEQQIEKLKKEIDKLNYLLENEQHKLQENLEQKEYLEDILSHVPGHVYWLNKDNVYLGCNNLHAKNTLLASRHEVVGKTNFDMPWKNQAEEFDRVNTQIMETGIPISREESEMFNGVYRTFLSQKVPLFNKKHEVIGILGISVDITDRKKLEEDINIAKEKAEAANYIMTEFIANMGHDMVTPLSDVGAIAQMLDFYKDEYPDSSELVDTLSVRYAACEEVLKHIINATSISSLDVNPERFSTLQELLLLEKEFRPTIISKKLKLFIHPLKPRKEDFIETDRAKFHAILVALLSNAINFTEEGSITISTSKQDGWFTIQVTDTGIGIPSDKYDYIFEQYTKLSRSNKYGATFKGVGAGLYLARIRANILGATISVNSDMAKGSTFTLAIPAYPPKN
jgi:two-component system aerobic respiration control sensor histidine kinase ArcB